MPSHRCPDVCIQQAGALLSRQIMECSACGRPEANTQSSPGKLMADAYAVERERCGNVLQEAELLPHFISALDRISCRCKEDDVSLTGQPLLPHSLSLASKSWQHGI
jgi:hypothetical protein